MLRQLIRGFDDAAKWNRAMAASRDRQFAVALGILRSASPESRTLIHWRVEEVGLLLVSHQLEEAIDAALAFLRSMPTVLTADEEYLRCYVQETMWPTYKAVFPGLPQPDYLKLSYDRVNLSEVRPRWKRLFPLRDHPGWDNSGA